MFFFGAVLKFHLLNEQKTCAAVSPLDSECGSSYKRGFFSDEESNISIADNDIYDGELRKRKMAATSQLTGYMGTPSLMVEHAFKLAFWSMYGF